MISTCQQCGIEFKTRKKERRYCGSVCYHASRTGLEIPLLRRVPTERVCDVCGAAFSVGGSSGHRLRQRVCSIACRSRQRRTTGEECRQLDPLKAAYFAGFVDGEGTIAVMHDRQTLSIRFGVGNTHRGVIDQLKEATGLGGIHAKQPTPANRYRAPIYYWQTNGAAAVSALRQLRPYLVVKSEQADLAIEIWERLQARKRDDDRSWQAEYRDKMQMLNRRGPRGSMNVAAVPIADGHDQQPRRAV